MKRKLLRITTLLLAVIFSAMLTTACSVYSSGEVTVKLNSLTENHVVFTVQETDGKATALDGLKCLQDNEKITFQYEDSTYGAYITAINGVEEKIESTANSSKGSSWMLYTSDKDVAYEETTTEIDGVTYYSSSVGASSLIVKVGATYVWVYEEYSYTW